MASKEYELTPLGEKMCKRIDELQKPILEAMKTDSQLRSLILATQRKESEVVFNDK